MITRAFRFATIRFDSCQKIDSNIFFRFDSPISPTHGRNREEDQREQRAGETQLTFLSVSELLAGRGPAVVRFWRHIDISAGRSL